MKTIFYFILLFSIGLNSYADKLTLECKESAVIALKKLLEKDHKNVLSLQLDLTVAKLAYETKSEDNSTLEQYLRDKSKEISKLDDGKRKELVSIYSKYQKSVDLQEVEKVYQEAVYWDKNIRLYNKDISPGILLLKHLGTKSKMNDIDAAIVWAARKLSDAHEEKYGRNSAKHNLTNVSTRVAFLLDQIRDGSDLRVDDLRKRIDSKKDQLDKSFQSLKKEFLASVPDNCNENDLKLLCKNEVFNDLYKEMLMRVEKLNLTDEIVVKELEKQVEDKVKKEEKKLEKKIVEKPPVQAPLDPNGNASAPAAAEKKQEVDIKPLTKDSWGDVKYQVSLLENEPLNEVMEKQNTINQSTNEKLKIQSYENIFQDRHYSIIDKKRGKLDVFDPNGEQIASMNIKMEKLGTSDQVKGDKNLAGGRYAVGKDDDKSNFLYLKGERDDLLKIEIGEKTCFSEECKQLGNGAETASYYLNDMMMGTLNTYVLPEDEDLKFVAKDKDLKLADFSDEKRDGKYNISPRSKKASPIKFRVKPGLLSKFLNDEDDEDEVRKTNLKGFLTTLEREKSKIMSLYDLDDEEYDRLAVMAVGMLGQESEFGLNDRYNIKEGMFGQLLVNTAKMAKGDKSANSRGLTQIKKAPDKIADAYNMKTRPSGRSAYVWKENEDGKRVRVRKEGTVKMKLLRDPKYAAVSTMGFLAETLDFIKGAKSKHEEIDHTNAIDYIPYVYNKGVGGILNGSAKSEHAYKEKVDSFSSGIELHRSTTAEIIETNREIAAEKAKNKKTTRRQRRDQRKKNN